MIEIYGKERAKKWCEKCRNYVVCTLTDKKPKCFEDRKTEPQTDCEKCKHYLFTDIDGYYCEHETYGQPCSYEQKDEPQTDCPKTCPQRDVCTKDATDCIWKKGESDETD